MSVLYSGTLPQEFSFNTWACKMIGIDQPTKRWSGAFHFEVDKENENTIYQKAVASLAKEYGKPLTKEVNFTFTRHGRSSEGWQTVCLTVYEY